MKHYRKAATRHDRLDETFLANLQLILIAIYLKNTAKNPTSVNTPQCSVAPELGSLVCRFLRGPEENAVTFH